MKSIRMKLIIPIVAIFLLSMSALGGLNYWKARSIMIDNIQQTLIAESEKTAAGVTEWFETRQMELKMLASNPTIVKGDPEEIIPILTSALKTNDIYDSLVYANPSGMSWDPHGTVVNISDREYFAPVLEGQTYISNPLVSRSTGNLVSIVAVPIKNEDQVVGILFGPVSIESITEQILNLKVAETGFAYVIQDDGLVIVHPDQEIAGQQNLLTDENIPPSLQNITKQMTLGQCGLGDYTIHGIDKYVAYAPIAGTKWSVAVNVPKAETTKEVAALLYITLAITLVILVLASLFVVYFARRITKPIKFLEGAVDRLASGDMSQIKLNIISRDELGRLGTSVSKMAENLFSLIRKVQEATEKVSSASEELTASADQATQAANHTASSISAIAVGAEGQLKAAHETAELIKNMAANMTQIAENTQKVTEHTHLAALKAREGDKVAENAEKQITRIEETVLASAGVVTKLGERSQEIGVIVETISDIAAQTNLLAFNAAIEAAQAGEQGKGFAVVADEVLKLAEQAQDSAGKIAELINAIQIDTESAVNAMEHGTREVKEGAQVVITAGETFREIAALVSEISDQITEISSAIQTMAVRSGDVVKSINEIDNLSRKSADEAQVVSAAAEEQLAVMEEIASSSQVLAQLAQDLQNAVSIFRL
ncbi:MAG: methyl-accepting chemotaxis protein [Desulfitobacteriia bacterium]|jgi:methyl-accepting chemotaxis protein